MTKEAKKQHNELDENLVTDYLRSHPDFFVHRDDLVLQMKIPHQRGGTVSLVEKQVALLRERHRDEKKKLDGYIRAAGENDAIFKKCKSLVLSLIDAKDSDEFFNALEHSFRVDFKCSAYSLIAFDDDARQLNHFTSVVSEKKAREYIGALMKNSKPALGPLRPSEQEFLFRDQATRVKSAAVIPMKREKQPLALLAIGSSDPQYFRSDMGTLFIGFIAETLSSLLPRYAELD